MPCTPYPVNGIICGPRRRMAPCYLCRKAHTHLCDYPTFDEKTCSRKLCGDHRVKGGPGRDYCPAHAKLLPTPDTSPSSQMTLKLLEGK